MKKAPLKNTKVAATTPKPKAKVVPVKAAPVITKVTAVKKAPVKAVKKTAVVAPKLPAAPAVKAAAKKSAVTVITAVVDIGFGNALFIRGEGAGLSWDVGVPLECGADNQWQVSLPATGSSIAYKLLINDFNWSVGEDYQAAPGSTVTVMPAF